MIYDEIDDIQAANALFRGRVSDARMRYELETLSSREAEGAFIKATGEVSNVLLRELSRCRPLRMAHLQREQLTKSIEHRISSALESGKTAEEAQSAKYSPKAIAFNLTKLHFLVQELTHTLCIHHQLPQYQRTLWFKMLVEHPTEDAQYIDMYEHGREPWSKVIRDMEKRLFTNDKKKPLSGKGPYFMMAADHGKKSWAEGMQSAPKIVSDKRYAEMWRLHAESDRVTHRWGNKPVAYLWRQSVISKLKNSRKRKTETPDQAKDRKAKKRSRREKGDQKA